MSFIRTSLLALLCACALPATVVVQNDIPAVMFNLLGDEGTGNPDYSGTDGAGTCSFTDLGWDAGPPVSMSGNNSSTVGTCGTGLDSIDLANFTVTGCISPDTFGVNGSTRIVQKGSATQESYSVLLVNSTSTIRGTVFSSPTENRFIEASITVNDGWKHFGVVFENCGTPAVENCNGQIYLDGSPVSTSTGGIGTGNRLTDAAFDVRIFNRGQGDRAYDGLANKLAVRGAALNALQAEFLSGQAACGSAGTAAVTTTDCSDFSGLFPDLFDDRPESEWDDDDDACDPWPEIDDRS